MAVAHVRCMGGSDILIAGGYGEVGRRLATELERAHPECVIAGGRHPEKANGLRGRRIDVGDRASIDHALEGVGVVVACVRQREPHLLHAAIERGIAYTSIAPPRVAWSDVQALHEQAKRTGARVVWGTGLEPGISSVLARLAHDRLGRVDKIETALLLSLGDSYGPDSMGFIFDEVTERYAITIDDVPEIARAFERPKVITFPPPIGRRRAYTMPFTDQRYYPCTLGARTAIARIALDPPWLGPSLAMLLRAGLRTRLERGGARGRLHGLIEKLRARHAGENRFALVVDVRAGDRAVRSTLVGHRQADATAAGAFGVAEALVQGEVDASGVWLAEEVIEPKRFIERLRARGLVPSTSESFAKRHRPLGSRAA